MQTWPSLSRERVHFIPLAGASADRHHGVFVSERSVWVAVDVSEWSGDLTCPSAASVELSPPTSLDGVGKLLPHEVAAAFKSRSFGQETPLTDTPVAQTVPRGTGLAAGWPQSLMTRRCRVGKRPRRHRRQPCTGATGARWGQSPQPCAPWRSALRGLPPQLDEHVLPRSHLILGDES